MGLFGIKKADTYKLNLVIEQNVLLAEFVFNILTNTLFPPSKKHSKIKLSNILKGDIRSDTTQHNILK